MTITTLLANIKYLTRTAGMLCLAAVLVAASAQAAAQTVYRCGPAAAVSYTQTPCAGGRRIDVGDPRSAAQQADAHEVTIKNEVLGNAMAQDRREAEAAIRPASAGSLSAPRLAARAAPAQSQPKLKPKRATQSRQKSRRANLSPASGARIAVPVKR